LPPTKGYTMLLRRLHKHSLGTPDSRLHKRVRFGLTLSTPAVLPLFGLPRDHERQID